MRSRYYSETRVGVSRRQRIKVDATIRERRPTTKLTRATGTPVSLKAGESVETGLDMDKCWNVRPVFKFPDSGRQRTISGRIGVFQY